MQSSDFTSLGNLSAFVEHVVGTETLRIEERLGAGFVRLKISEAERRQAKQDIRCVEDAVCELVRNSRDAKSTKIFIATMRDGAKRSLLVIDDGVGIPEEFHPVIFEPRVTGKLETAKQDKWGIHGRGMALYSIKENALQARIVRSQENQGCSVLVEFDTASIPERSDQSTIPIFSKSDYDDGFLTKGPRNILRTVAEIALDGDSHIKYFVGSPVEILATLVHEGLNDQIDDDLVKSDSSIPCWQIPSYAKNPKELMEHANAIGIEVSERTCYRILKQEIKPLREIKTLVRNDDVGRLPGTVDLIQDRRGLKLSNADTVEFQDALTDAFNVLSERYFLHLSDTPRIKVSKNKVSVTFEYVNDE